MKRIDKKGGILYESSQEESCGWGAWKGEGKPIAFGGKPPRIYENGDVWKSLSKVLFREGTPSPGRGSPN